MKNNIIFVEIKEGKVDLDKKQLEELLDKAYHDGYNDGYDDGLKFVPITYPSQPYYDPGIYKPIVWCSDTLDTTTITVNV